VANPYIRLEHIHKAYGDTPVIDDLNLSVNKRERLIMLGPSGCGKSTTLRMIAGLEPVTSGDLYFGDRRVNDLAAGDRNISMVFQDYALYPHMTVEKNISYALRINKVHREEINRRVKTVISILQLNSLEQRFPRDLSGGQRQRVALARAIAKQSPIFLLDEPLSNLDAQMRISARKQLLHIHRLYHQTFIYVTHDQVEAMTLADRIALMNHGILQMLDTPYNIYHHPANVFAATFIGTPASNILSVQYQNATLRFKEAELPVESYWRTLIESSGCTRFLLGIRPEHIQTSKMEKLGSLTGVVDHMEEYGNDTGLIFQFEGIEMTAISDRRDWSSGEKFFFNFNQKNMYLFDEATSNAIGYPSD
jgi:ABC-type sugar transport system ATPase subunit